MHSLHYARTFSFEVLAEAFRCHMDHYQWLGDEVCFPVHGGWDSRVVSVVGVFDCVKKCMSFVM